MWRLFRRTAVVFAVVMKRFCLNSVIPEKINRDYFPGPKAARGLTAIFLCISRDFISEHIRDSRTSATSPNAEIHVKDVLFAF